MNANDQIKTYHRGTTGIKKKELSKSVYPLKSPVVNSYPLLKSVKNKQLLLTCQMHANICKIGSIHL